MAQALQRGLALLHSRVIIDAPPAWMLDLDFTHAMALANPWTVGSVVLQMRAAERTLRQRASTRTVPNTDWVPLTPAADVPPLPSWAAEDEDAQKRMVVALGRLGVGAAIEAAIANEALDHCTPGGRNTETDGRMARLYNDAHLVAIWTSAHAQYVSYIQSGVEEPPCPGLNSIPNAAVEFDISDLFSRRFCQRLCAKSASPLLQILCRCTNPGSRGWDTLLDSALAESMAARSVVSNAVTIALSAMHPFIHPALRPPWNKRMCIMRIAAHRLTDADTRSQLVGTAAATKEAVRRMLASSVAAAPAMQAAFARVSHPVGLLTSPPLRLPHRGMEGAMATFARAGEALLTNDALAYHTIVKSQFHTAQRETTDAPPVAMEWDAPWLGKGTSAAHQKIPLVAVSSELWAVAFRTNFIVFWAHSMTNQMRASRLDTAQHRALHELNTCTALVNKLSEEKQLAMQRLALNHLSSGLLTMEEVAHLLGIAGVCGTSSNGGTKGPQDTLRVLSSAGAEATAQMLAFSRVAWVGEQLLVVDLGPRTKALQLKALYKRQRCPGYHVDTACHDQLPIHATHLHACVECRRVANAYYEDDQKTPASFTELGISSSMLCTQCSGPDQGETHIRCAKRSSAALRSAVAFEEEMHEKQVEFLPTDPVTVTNLLGNTSVAEQGSDNGIAARVRRDAKNALEQRAVALACGEQPMLCIPVVGRAIRLWNEWFALCSYCGAMLRVLPQNRYGGEICCRRCDAQMLGAPAPARQERKASVCRYCTATDTTRSASRWKAIKAPLDMAGENATLPSPLRSVHYCPQHWRTWLSAAHRVMPTRLILSHIAHNAKPVFSSTDKGRSADELGFDAPKGRKRRRARGEPRDAPEA